DAPIFPGSTLNWDDTPFSTTFFINAVNDNGDLVIGGLTNSGNVNRDAFLVYYPNGGPSGFILFAEGDPIDLNGDGLFNDDAFVATFGNDDFQFTSSGRAYFVVTVRNAAGTTTGNAFVTALIPEPAHAGVLLAAAALLPRRRRR
ncbi:MAG: hypothetical protein NZ561_08895, partial [Phycisphaerae bacterium]|nr:hypothetical protein [Phycisphaerae bacterium]